MVLVEMLTVAFLFANLKQFTVSAIQAATDDCSYYVSSLPKLDLNVSETCPCKTIDDYALNITSNLEGRENATIMFLQGVHNLTRDLTIEEKLNITMMGKISQSHQDYPHFLLCQGNVTFQKIINLKLSNLSIVGFSRNSVSIRSVYNVILENIVINGSALLIQCIGCKSIYIFDIHFIGSVLVIAWPEYYLNTDRHAYKSVLIRDALFQLSPTGNGLSCCNVYSLEIINISVGNLPPNCTSKPPESGLITFCRYFPWGLIQREVCDLITTNVVTMDVNNSTFKRSSGTGLCVEAHSNASIKISRSTIINHMNGGAIFTYANNGIVVCLKNNTFSNNTNTMAGSEKASAVSVYTVNIENTDSKLIPKLYIHHTNFEGNRHLVSRSMSTVSITSHSIEAKVYNSNFTDNYGSAITAYTTKKGQVLVSFLGVIIFKNNTAHRGGAIHLFNARIGIYNYAKIYFDSNFATDVGGAIYIHSSKWYQFCNDYSEEAITYDDCFYVFRDCKYNKIQIQFTIKFENNKAQNGGEHIFGAAVISDCIICPLLNTHIIKSEYLSFFFKFSQPTMLNFSPISSHPKRVCICNHNSLFYTPPFFCTNVSQIFLSRSVYPGEEFSFEAVLVGAEFGAVTGTVYAQFLNQSDSKLYPLHQYTQRIDNFRKCKQLNYTVYSSKSQEVLVLTSSNGKVLTYGDKLKIESDTRFYEKQLLYNIAPRSALYTPVYINLTILPCPQGFQLIGSPPKCDCIPALIENDMFCKFTNGIGYIYRSGTKWVGILNENSITMQKRCPFDYCFTHLTGVDLRYPDTQCAMNHAGILCGACKKGFSLALGTNICLSCSGNKNLGLLLFFVLAGVLLVVFIKILNMTISQGTINGLVFYANVAWAYQNIFFPKNISNTWFSLMRVFIAWLNLDFGIKTCFVDGLTGYVKIWLQFAFPLYIWGIAGAMVILAHYSKKMTKLFGNNCVQVLATLFLLSYAKLFRTIITVMAPAVIEVYPQSSDRRSGSIIVWAFDGNLSYCGNPHGFLFVVALLTLMLLWLPYTMVLLLHRLLMKKSSLKCFRCLIKLVPLIETYFGPLKIAHYYWVGVLLLVRGIIWVIFTLTYTTTPTASLLCLVMVLSLLLVFLAYTGRMYKNKLLSLLELSFLLNLQVLGVSVLFIDVELSNASKEVAVNISVSIAFIQFLGIISFHVYQLIHKAVKHHCCPVKNENSETTESVPASDRYHLMEGESVNDLVKRELIGLQYLEDYAENSDSHKKN